AELGAAEALTRQTKLAVAERYVDVLRAESGVAVSERLVEGLAAHLREVEDLYRGGSVPRNDFLAAAVSLADAEQRLVRARNALAVARAAYNRALGRPRGGPVGCARGLPGIYLLDEAETLENLTAIAIDRGGGLRRAATAADASACQGAAARAATRPQLALTGGYFRLENEFLNRDD